MMDFDLTLANMHTITQNTCNFRLHHSATAILANVEVIEP